MTSRFIINIYFVGGFFSTFFPFCLFVTSREVMTWPTGSPPWYDTTLDFLYLLHVTYPRSSSLPSIIVLVKLSYQIRYPNIRPLLSIVFSHLCHHTKNKTLSQARRRNHIPWQWQHKQNTAKANVCRRLMKNMPQRMKPRAPFVLEQTSARLRLIMSSSDCLRWYDTICGWWQFANGFYFVLWNVLK